MSDMIKKASRGAGTLDRQLVLCLVRGGHNLCPPLEASCTFRLPCLLARRAGLACWPSPADSSLWKSLGHGVAYGAAGLRAWAHCARATLKTATARIHTPHARLRRRRCW